MTNNNVCHASHQRDFESHHQLHKSCVCVCARTQVLASTYTFFINVLCYSQQDLDIETLAHIDAENRRQTLQEEIDFLKSVHEQVINTILLADSD